MARGGAVVSHWHTLIDDFNTSTLEFYQAVEQAVMSREVPEVLFSRVEFKEGGFASANREYLRIERSNVAFDICGAPYGNGFFFSWWVSKVGPRYPLLYLIGFLFLAAVGSSVLVTVLSLPFSFSDSMLAAFAVLLTGPLAVISVLVALAVLARKGVFGPEEHILAIPVLGWIYDKVFNPITFYSLDTALMFQESIRRAVHEVINGLIDEKGIRALTAEEQKPTIRDLAR